MIDARIPQLLLAGLSLLMLQEALMGHVAVFGVHPELLLLGAICVAISGGPRRGAVAGFVAGLATDIYGSSTVGVTALSFTVAVWLVGRLVDDRPTAFAAAFSAFVGTAGALLLLVLVGRMVDGISTSTGHALWVFIVAGAINAALGAFIAPRMVNMWRAREFSW